MDQTNKKEQVTNALDDWKDGQNIMVRTLIFLKEYSIQEHLTHFWDQLVKQNPLCAK